MATFTFIHLDPIPAGADTIVHAAGCGDISRDARKGWIVGDYQGADALIAAQVMYDEAYVQKGVDPTSDDYVVAHATYFIVKPCAKEGAKS